MPNGEVPALGLPRIGPKQSAMASRRKPLRLHHYTISYLLVSPSEEFPREIQLKAKSKQHAIRLLKEKVRLEEDLNLEILSVA
jgi:hypothetical protein